jgi:hypothetical protein
VDYVVGVIVHLAHDGFAILFWILRLQQVLAKPLAFLLLDVFLLFLVYRSRKDNFCYCSYGSKKFNSTCTRIFYMHVFEW